MPLISNNSISDYDIENDCEKEQFESDSENGQNLIKCGEILLFKYNLLISCNYCEEILNNFEIFTKHLIEKHLNYELHQFNTNNDSEIKIILDDNTIEDNHNTILIYSNELEENENYKYINIPNSSNLCYFHEYEDNIKTEHKEEVNDNNVCYSNEQTELFEDISKEVEPIITNYEDIQMLNKKPIELEHKYMPMMGNSFKKNSETYEQKFYKYCKLFKEKEANVGRDHLHEKFNNNKSNVKQVSIPIKTNPQINELITEIPNNIKSEPNFVIFDDNLIDEIIEEDVTAMTFIENSTENIDIIEETVSFAEHNVENINVIDEQTEVDDLIKTENININNHQIEIKNEDHLLNNLLQNNEIKTDNLVDTDNIVKLGDEIKLTTINSDRNSKTITAISTKLNNLYHCPDCPRYYTRFETLKIHYRSHTGEKNPHTCSICQKAFSAPCKLIQHERVHTGERPYKCTLCPQAFKAKQKLKNHLESHEKGTIKRPSIYIGGVSTLERQPACLPILINNKFITSSEAKKEDGLYHCPVCERKYRRFESLKEHAEVHVETKQYECQICNKRFTKIRSLRVHLKSHTPNKNIRWNGVPIACDYCEKTFNNKYYLNEHLSVHSGKRPYECNTCNKKFAFKSNFVLHERTHSGDKRYQCRYCDMKFVQSTTKVRHERVVHLKQPPFTCRFCQKGFYTLSIYKKHINDHKIDEILSSSKEIYDENGENIIANDNVEQTIIVDNNEENIIVVEPEDLKVNDFICSLCGAYFVDCGQYIEHCKSHDNNINEQNIVHYMEDDIVGSEEIIV